MAGTLCWEFCGSVGPSLHCDDLRSLRATASAVVVCRTRVKLILCSVSYLRSTSTSVESLSVNPKGLLPYKVLVAVPFLILFGVSKRTRHKWYLRGGLTVSGGVRHTSLFDLTEMS